MEDVLEQVMVAFACLLGEEVMGLERDSLCQIRRTSSEKLFLETSQVLDDQGQIFVLGCELE